MDFDLARGLQFFMSGFQTAVFVPILYSLMASLGLILNVWNTGDMQQDAWQAGNGTDYSTSFDFIIGKENFSTGHL